MSLVSSRHSNERPLPLHVCPTEPESLTFPTHWHRLPENEVFLICTKCYEDNIRETSFASQLRCDYLDFGPGSTATCDFNTPRIDSLLRQAVASNNFQLLQSFAGQRLSIKSCPGIQGSEAGNGTKWFKPVNDDIPDFVCCEACYEDVILALNFGHNLVSHWDQQPTNQIWSCDLAVPYLRRILPGFARRGDWHGFAQAAHHRMSLPVCMSAAPVFAYTRKWFNTVRPSPIRDMTACEACFLDRAGWQQNAAQNFAQVAVSPHDFGSRFICGFRLTAMAACSDILLAHGMFEKWHHSANLTLSKRICSAKGIVDGEWYGLANPNDATQNVENFEICAACHAGFNQSADWGHLFRRLNLPPGTERLCDFNPSAPRYFHWNKNWNQLYFTRDPAPFIDYIARLAPTPICQAIRRLKDARWYGDKDASLLICPSCFEEAVHGTHFASAFPLQNTLIPDADHCSLYSHRMRVMYTEACKQQSLDSLFSFAVMREKIYQETIPQIEVFMNNQRQKVELLKITSAQREFSTRVPSLSNGFSGGNPIVSNYDMGIMPQTILVEHQRRQLTVDPRRPMVMQLEARWKEVE